MQSARMKAEFDRDGFVVVRQFLAPEDFQSLRENLDRYIREVVPRLPDSDAFYDDKSRPETLKQMSRIEQDPFFAEYLQHPRWKTLASALLDEGVRSHGAEWFNKPPGTNHITPPHQDNFYFCLQPPRVLTMWLALDQVDDENGCLRYVRGSHRLGIRPHNRTQTLGFSQGIFDYTAEDRENEVKIHAQPNDLLIHHGNTIHRADANGSGTRHRRSFAIVFQGESCRRDDEAFQRYLDSARVQHQTLGLNT